MTIEVNSEDRDGILSAYAAILPLALKWSPDSTIKILVPKEEPIEDED